MIMYPLFHPSIFHPPIIIILGRASIIPGLVGRNAGRENHPEPDWPECEPRHRPNVKIKLGPSQSPDGQNRSIWRENHPRPDRPERGPVIEPKRLERSPVTEPKWPERGPHHRAQSAIPGRSTFWPTGLRVRPSQSQQRRPKSLVNYNVLVGARDGRTQSARACPFFFFPSLQT